jgi:hypothetical protein
VCENESVSCLGYWFGCSTKWIGVLTCGTKEAKQVTLQLCCTGCADGPSGGVTDCLVGVSRNCHKPNFVSQFK